MSEALAAVTPLLASPDPAVVVRGIVEAARRGVPVIATRSVIERYGHLLEALGIRARPLTGGVPERYVMLRLSGVTVRITVHSGRETLEFRVGAKRFEQALRSLAERVSGPAGGEELVLLEVPPELAVAAGDQGEGGERGE